MRKKQVYWSFVDAVFDVIFAVHVNQHDGTVNSNGIDIAGVVTIAGQENNSFRYEFVILEAFVEAYLVKHFNELFSGYFGVIDDRVRHRKSPPFKTMIPHPASQRARMTMHNVCYYTWPVTDYIAFHKV